MAESGYQNRSELSLCCDFSGRLSGIKCDELRCGSSAGGGANYEVVIQPRRVDCFLEGLLTVGGEKIVVVKAKD
jgi:hypothetical protein